MTANPIPLSLTQPMSDSVPSRPQSNRGSTPAARRRTAPTAVPCPYCGARASSYCRSRRGVTVAPHKARERAYRAWGRHG